MKIVLGIGNPGKQYEFTKHNMGFDVIDVIVKKLNLNQKTKFNGIFYEYKINNEKIIFIKPQSYVNLSGEVLIKYINYFNVNLDDILVISDDLDQNIGSFKLRKKGSSGGHNGLKNIEKNIGSNIYKRIKIGISNDKNINTADYVLSAFSKESRQIIDEVILNVAGIVIEWINGIDFNILQNKYNKK